MHPTTSWPYNGSAFSGVHQLGTTADNASDHATLSRPISEQRKHVRCNGLLAACACRLLAEQVASVHQELRPARVSMARHDDQYVRIAFLKSRNRTRPTIEVSVARIAHRVGC